VQRSSRKLLVGAIALVGIILIALGVVELRELMIVGKVPPESLGRQVAYTTISLAVGLWLIVWYLVPEGCGLAGTRGERLETRRGLQERDEMVFQGRGVTDGSAPLRFGPGCGAQG